MTKAPRSSRSRTRKPTPRTAAASSTCATAGLLIRKGLALVLALGAGAAAGAGCGRPAPASKSYELTGQILAVHPDKQSLTIKHQDIPGYMPGMTMTIAALEAALVTGR